MKLSLEVWNDFNTSTVWTPKDLHFLHRIIELCNRSINDLEKHVAKEYLVHQIAQINATFGCPVLTLTWARSLKGFTQQDYDKLTELAERLTRIQLRTKYQLSKSWVVSLW